MPCVISADNNKHRGLRGDALAQARARMRDRMTEEELRWLISVAENPAAFELLKDEGRDFVKSKGQILKAAQALMLAKKFSPAQAMSYTLKKFGCGSLAKFGNMHQFAAELERQVDAGQLAAVQKKKGREKTEKMLLRPYWVSTSEAARTLGVERNTIMSWYRAQTLVLPSEQGPRVYKLKKDAMGRVDLTLLAEIVRRKKALPTPGRALGGGPAGAVVAAAVQAHGSRDRALDLSRFSRAARMAESIRSVPLLQQLRRQVNRAILKRRRA